MGQLVEAEFTNPEQDHFLPPEKLWPKTYGFADI
jgi:hypothetical protein